MILEEEARDPEWGFLASITASAPLAPVAILPGFLCSEPQKK